MYALSLASERFKHRGRISDRPETYAQAETFAVQAFYQQGFLLSEQLPDV